MQVIAYRKSNEATFSFVPEADRVFEEGDVIVLLGKTEDVSRIEKF